MPLSDVETQKYQTVPLRYSEDSISRLTFFALKPQQTELMYLFSTDTTTKDRGKIIVIMQKLLKTFASKVTYLKCDL